LYLKRIFLIFVLTACTKTYDSAICDDLSMKTYKGFPNEAYELKRNCQGIKITYTKALCQKAFQKLILSGDEALVKNIYGAKIMTCFTNYDKEKFLKK